jgi:aminoglycoside phosphotransferase (APT) family kinase protein
MNNAIDRPVDARPGEALDVTRLAPYLREILGLDGDVEVLQYPSGFSNLTYMLLAADGPYARLVRSGEALLVA